VAQVDDFAGRVKAKRGELGPRTTLSSLADRLNDGRLPDGEVAAKSGERDPQAVRSGRATVPSGASADRDSCVAKPGLWLNPQLWRIPAEMRAELTSAEIAASGSYFDDVLRDPRR
jgi:hypothetical protein